mmetsp:Transcript_7491/g.13110  ORF Transcript_7491/g.13110 Transcript_7491/m.13110 type:complete len:236 (+) Transcript_7491:1977-2684(+)
MEIVVTQGDEIEHEGDSKQAESDHSETHDGTASKGYTEGRVESFLIGRLSRTDVGICCDDHAKPSGRSRQQGTGQEATSVTDTIRLVSRGRIDGVEDDEDGKDDDNKCRQVLVLGGQKGTCARLDLVRDLVHEVVSSGSLLQLMKEPEGEKQRNSTGSKSQRDSFNRTGVTWEGASVDAEVGAGDREDFRHFLKILNNLVDTDCSSDSCCCCPSKRNTTVEGFLVIRKINRFSRK